MKFLATPLITLMCLFMSSYSDVSQSQQGTHEAQGGQQEAISQQSSQDTSTVSLPVQSALDTSMVCHTVTSGDT